MIGLLIQRMPGSPASARRETGWMNMDMGQGTLPKDAKRPEGIPPLAKPCRDGVGRRLLYQT